MKNKELVEAVSSECGLPKENVKVVMEALFGVISDELYNGESVSIASFGKFSRVHRAPRAYYNVHYGKKGVTEDQNVVKFTPSATLKMLVK